MPIKHVFTSPQADVADPTLVRPTDWNSDHAYSLQDAVSLIGNTSGVLANVSTGTLYLAGGNNITLSQNANSVTISAASIPVQSNQTLGLYGSSNTQLTSSGTVDARSMTIRAMGSLTVAVSASEWVLSAPNALTTAMASNRGSDFVQATAVFAGTNALGTIASGGISVAVAAPIPIGTNVKDVASAGSTGTITRYAPEDHAHRGVGQVQISGNTSNTSNIVFGSVVLAGGNNITLSQVSAAGGATITIVGAAETQTVPAIGTNVKAVASVGSTGTLTRFAPEDHQHAGVAALAVTNTGNTAGNTRSQVGTLYLAASGGLTASQSTGAAGNDTIWFSAAADIPLATTVKSVLSANSLGTVTRYAAEDHGHEGVYAVGASNIGNTLGNTVVQAGRVVLAGGNNITLSVSTAAGGLQTITISGPAAGGAQTAISSIIVSDATYTSGLVSFSNAGNITISSSVNGATQYIVLSGHGAESNWISMLGIATAGSNTASGTTLGLSGLNLTLSGTNNSQMVLSVPATSSLSATGIVSLSTNGSTISIGASLPLLSFYANLPVIQTGTAITATSGSSIYVVPFVLPQNISVGWVRLFGNFSDSAVGTGGTTSANQTFSVARYTTVGLVFYTQGVGASSLSLQSFTSTSGGITGMTQYRAAAQGSQYTISLAKTYPASGGADQNYATSYAVSSGSIVVSSNSNTLFTGNRFLDLSFQKSLSAGNYWLGIGASTSSLSNSSHISFAGTCAMALSLLGVSQTDTVWGILGIATNVSQNQLQPGLGLWTTNASGWSKDSIGIASISQVVSNLLPAFQLVRRG